METAVLSMVRNEADIIGGWISHALALFDHVYVADHGSTDGTREYLEQRSSEDSRLRVLRYDAPSFDKEAVIQHLRVAALSQTKAEWLFPLDPDEFFLHPSKQALHDSLMQASGDVVSFRWRNCYPAIPGSFSLDFNGFRQKRLSRVCKVAVRRRIAEDGAYYLPKGAHDVFHRTRGVVPTDEIGELCHIPIRSLEQLWEKLLKGTAHRLTAYDGAQREGESWHYPELLQRAAEAPSWDAVPALVNGYAENARNGGGRRLRRGARDAFEAYAFRFAGMPSRNEGTDSAAGSKVDLLPLDAIAAESRYQDLVRTIVTRDPDERMPLTSELREAAGTLRPRADFGDCKFDSLLRESPRSITRDDIAKALQASLWKADYCTESSWGSHLPFLFSLIAFLKPRRHVQLGVGNGLSFLAACQAVAVLGRDGVCIGVDEWAGGDPRSGEAAKNFEIIRRKLIDLYPERGGYIRASSEQAAQQFAPASIDLLHLHGFRSAEMLEREFGDWSAKLSSSGVVLLDGIANTQSGAGAWRLWCKLRDRHPHLALDYGEGLGLVAVGEDCPFRQPLEGLPGDTLLSPENAEIIQLTFTGIGPSTWRVIGLTDELERARNLPFRAQLAQLLVSFSKRIWPF